ncbi:ATP-binding cassette domain-containing protein [Paenibacillus cymbidii]|uniref:ATP-binding cassette domain-containing protein n=1 Tax=Paenibacillus cymbidii TaxID=1639034 RepID=UPI0010811471|nr:ATP-binding cassette domain-containing protein [Paenibacillus cymbidii]
MPIELNDVTVRRDDDPQDHPILSQITCLLEDRRLTLLVGQTGSGKTTLLRALAGLAEPSAGSVSYDGSPLWRRGKPDRELLLRSAIAFQFPEHQLFAPTLQREFDYSLHPYRLDAEERRRRVAAAMTEQRLPAAWLETSPFTLSGGEKRRAAQATVTAAEAPWLLLDEPTAGLDAASAAQLTAWLAHAKSRCGIVLSTHDLDALFPVADRILVLREGRIVADTTPEALYADPQPLVDAGVGLTGAMETAMALRAAGVRVPPGSATPERMADAIVETLREGAAKQAVPPPVEAAEAEAALPESGATTGQGRRRGIAYRLDAKVKWALYMLLAAGVIMQRDWFGTLFGLLLAACCLPTLIPADRAKLLRMSRPLLFFLLLTTAISGLDLHLGADSGSFIGFQWPRASVTAQNLLDLFAVTVFGIAFALSTSSLDMYQGLHQALFKLRLHKRLAMLTLAASLLLRFIPLILEEAERFAVIAKARGKRAIKRGRLHFRELPVFAIPLLMSLFINVEELILAMELKNVTGGAKQPLPQRSAAGSVRRANAMALCAGCLLFVVLLAVR